MARVLIGCETSGIVRDAFLDRGHDAWSCDLLPADTPTNRHIVGDIRDVMMGDWDMMAVMHPPCTRLTNSGVRWLTVPPPGRTAAEVMGSYTLQITATGQTWVKVSSSSGKTLYRRNLVAGQTHSIKINNYPVSVEVGQTENTQITDRGTPFDLSALASQGQARFELAP